MLPSVTIREVGLRDGLQLVKPFVATEHKLEWCRDDVNAGVREIEITSFVPPSIVPQFSDALALAREAVRIDGLVASALVPNLKGAQRAFEAGVQKINYVLSASEAHNQANVHRSTQDSLEDFRRITQERREKNLPTKVVGGIATTFGCTIQGTVPEKRVFEIIESLLSIGADEIILADTVGYANPAQVGRIFTEALRLTGGKPVFAHFHDTRGLGLANVTAAIDVGITRFDASLGGLGGCPFAPGATGNIDMEDCVFLVESMGFDTGINIEKLIAIRSKLERWLPGEQLHGMIARAGLPKTFTSRRSTSPVFISG
jgi:hydroxymethylglutaryl-CoA lyase